MNKPLVSIIIAAKDSEKTIEKCIDSVLQLDYENFEVIVVNDGSSDKTRDTLNKYSQKIKVVDSKSSLGPAKSRNMASAQAGGEYVAFTDADCIVDKNWLKELLNGFIAPGVVSVGGSQEIPSDESNFGRHVSGFMKEFGFISDYMHLKKHELINVSHNASCNVIYKREIFLGEDGFLAGLWPGEDVELDYRLRKKGHKLVFNSKAIVYHYRVDNLKKFFRMMFNYGRVQGFLVKRYGIFRRMHILPVLGIILLLIFILRPAQTTLVVIISFVLFWVYSADLVIVLLATSAFLFWNLGFLKGLFLRLNK